MFSILASLRVQKAGFESSKKVVFEIKCRKIWIKSDCFYEIETNVDFWEVGSHESDMYAATTGVYFYYTNDISVV